MRAVKKILVFTLALSLLFLLFKIFLWFQHFSKTSQARGQQDQALKRCQEQYRLQKKIPIVGGGFINTFELKGVGVGIGSRHGQCVAELLETQLWWDGKNIITQKPLRKNDLASFKVNLVLAMQDSEICQRGEGCSNEYGAGFIRKAVWPEELSILWKFNPLLELRVHEVPPSLNNKNNLSTFVLRNWNKESGRPRLIMCSWSTKGRLVLNDLLSMTSQQLASFDFRSVYSVCEMDMSDFEFVGGRGRLTFSAKELVQAPEAIKAINDFLNKLITKGEL